MNDIAHAARLVYFGLQDAAIPQEGEYRWLIQRFITDADFQQLARTVALGLEMDIVSVDPRSGAILTPNSRQSLFALNLTEYKRELAAESDDNGDVKRPVLALMHITVALTFFPTASDLADFARPQRPTATIQDVVATTLTLANQIRERVARETDLDATPSVLRQCYHEILDYPRRREGLRRASTSSLEGLALLVMRHLEMRRLLRRYAGNEAHDPFMATERYQHLLAWGTAPDAMEICRTLIAPRAAQSPGDPS